MFQMCLRHRSFKWLPRRVKQSKLPQDTWLVLVDTDFTFITHHHSQQALFQRNYNINYAICIHFICLNDAVFILNPITYITFVFSLFAGVIKLGSSCFSCDISEKTLDWVGNCNNIATKLSLLSTLQKLYILSNRFDKRSVDSV